MTQIGKQAVDSQTIETLTEPVWTSMAYEEEKVTKEA